MGELAPLPCSSVGKGEILSQLSSLLPITGRRAGSEVMRAELVLLLTSTTLGRAGPVIILSRRVDLARDVEVASEPAQRASDQEG